MSIYYSTVKEAISEYLTKTLKEKIYKVKHIIYKSVWLNLTVSTDLVSDHVWALFNISL